MPLETGSNNTMLGLVTNSPRGNTIEALLGDRYINAITNPKEDMPIIGDYVFLTENDGYKVEKILKRKNTLYRIKNGNKQFIAANIDVVFIVTSADDDFSVARLERYCILANKTAARICFVLTKTALNSNYHDFYQILMERFGALDYDVVEINYTKDMKALYDYWQEGETAILLGSSGVGKSTIINTLKGESVARTQPVRQYDHKGRHTTTERRAYVLSESRVLIDTPGLRAVGIEKSASSVNAIFPEIDALTQQCRFKNCTHTSEPGCMIQSALKSGDLNIDDYMRYLKLMQKQKELDIIRNGKEYEKEFLLREAKKGSKYNKGGRNV